MGGPQKENKEGGGRKLGRRGRRDEGPLARRRHRPTKLKELRMAGKVRKRETPPLEVHVPLAVTHS